MDLTFLILFLKFPVRNKLSYKNNGFLIWCLVCDFLLRGKKKHFVISVNCQFIITASVKTEKTIHQFIVSHVSLVLLHFSVYHKCSSPKAKDHQEAENNPKDTKRLMNTKTQSNQQETDHVQNTTVSFAAASSGGAIYRSHFTCLPTHFLRT